MATLQIDFPDEGIVLSGYTQTLLETMARETLVMRLYEEKRVSAQQAAQILKIPHNEFLQRLTRYGIAEHDELTALEAEIQHQTQLLQPETPLAHKLVETRARLIVAGEKLLDWDEIQAEVANRRGGLESRNE